MKKYVAPKIELVNLRVEERMAGSNCDGACTNDVTYNGQLFKAGINVG